MEGPEVEGEGARCPGSDQWGEMTGRSGDSGGEDGMNFRERHFVSTFRNVIRTGEMQYHQLIVKLHGA